MIVPPDTLLLGIAVAGLAAAAAFRLPEWLVSRLLVLSLPFQLISSKWMTSTVVAIYVVAAVAVLRRWIVYIPAPKSLLLLGTAYLLATDL